MFCACFCRRLATSPTGMCGLSGTACTGTTCGALSRGMQVGSPCPAHVGMIEGTCVSLACIPSDGMLAQQQQQQQSMGQLRASVGPCPTSGADLLQCCLLGPPSKVKFTQPDMCARQHNGCCGGCVGFLWVIAIKRDLVYTVNQFPCVSAQNRCCCLVACRPAGTKGGFATRMASSSGLYARNHLMIVSVCC
jgi:hypothetical protein